MVYLYFAHAGDNGLGGDKGGAYDDGAPDINLFPDYTGAGGFSFYRCFFAVSEDETPVSIDGVDFKIVYDGEAFDAPDLTGTKFTWGTAGKTLEGRKLLTTKYNTEVWARFYATDLDDDPFYKCQLVIENQPYSGITVPTGDFWGNAGISPSYCPSGIQVLCDLPFLLRFSDLHASGRLSQMTLSGVTYYSWDLLPSGSTTGNYLGAFQGRVWEFVIAKSGYCGYDDLWNILTGAPVTGAATQTLAAEYEDPLWAVPDIETLRESKAWWFGGFAAPLAVSSGDLSSFRSEMESEYSHELGKDQWGLWGGPLYVFGDIRDTHAPGTPRNHDGDRWIRRAVQARLPKLAHMTTEIANAQCLRVLERAFQNITDESKLSKTYLYQWKVYGKSFGGDYWNLYQDSNDYPAKNSPDPRATYDDQVYKEPHGFEDTDVDHVATEFLVDSYIYTANPFAYDEMYWMGHAYPWCWPNPENEFWGDPSKFGPAQWPKETRPEGWVNLAGVMAYQVHGASMLSAYQHAHERFIKMKAERESHQIPNPTGSGTIPAPEHDCEMASRYTNLPGYTVKATTFFQAGALCYGAIAAGRPDYAMDQIRGTTYPYHAWGRRCPLYSGKYVFDAAPAYYYETWVHPDSWTHAYGYDNTPIYWWTSTGSPGAGTADMVLSVFKYVAAEHEDPLIRSQVSGKIASLLTYYHGATSWRPDPDKQWSQWWDSFE